MAERFEAAPIAMPDHLSIAAELAQQTTFLGNLAEEADQRYGPTNDIALMARRAAAATEHLALALEELMLREHPEHACLGIYLGGEHGQS